MKTTKVAKANLMWDNEPDNFYDWESEIDTEKQGGKRILNIIQQYWLVLWGRALELLSDFGITAAYLQRAETGYGRSQIGTEWRYHPPQTSCHPGPSM